MLCVISSQLPLLHLTYDSMTLILSCVCGNSMTGVCVCVYCSLGISVLELACDLELPSGGDNWHRLRDGVLPREFTRGLTYCLSIQ